jgi:hypothetical protein
VDRRPAGIGDERYPDTNPERGFFVVGWQAPGGPITAAHVWRRERDGQATYFRAEVWRSGRAGASFTAPTLERLKDELERKYGGRMDRE